MGSTALERACEKLKQQEIERRKRRECELLKKQKRPLKPSRKRKGEPLLTWQFYLKQRQKLTKRIMKYTGKMPSQMLLNCSGLTEKAMIQKLLDHAERLSPENKWRHERLLNSKTRCGLLMTLPNEESVRRTFTIYGLPEVSKTESQSTCCIQNWFKSKAITQRLEERKFDIYNLVQHFPDVDGLQIIGRAAKLHTMDPQKIFKEESQLVQKRRHNKTLKSRSVKL